MSNKIIPFGKYKGQSFEILATDEKYANWLKSQVSFMKKYPALYAFLINNFQQPTDTPEHNKMMNLLLEDDFCIKLFRYLNRNIISGWVESRKILNEKILCRTNDGEKWEITVDRLFPLNKYKGEERETFDLPLWNGKLINENFKVNHRYFELKDGNDASLTMSLELEIAMDLKKLGRCENRQITFTKKTKPNNITSNNQVNKDSLSLLERAAKHIEDKKHSTNLPKGKLNLLELKRLKSNRNSANLAKDNKVTYWTDEIEVLKDTVLVKREHSYSYKIEVKPFVSDDFPTVMRQCRSQKSDVLLIGQYNGIGSTVEQVRAMFKDIKIVLLSDIT